MPEIAGRSSDPRPGPEASSGNARWVAFALASSLAIYVWGMAPTVLDRDSAELQAVALSAGVAHPAGYPLYTGVGWLFGRLVPGDPAFRINLVSAVMGAASVAALVGVGLELGFAAPVAFAAAILFGAGFSFWAGALRAEVYTLSTFVFLLAYWRTLRALRTDRPGDRALAAFLLGLSLTGQLSCAPAVAVMGLALAWRARRRALREWPVLVGLLLLGLTPYLYIPWADAHTHGLDHLRHVDRVFFPETGVPRGFFDTPWRRLGWLVLGRNLAPGSVEGFHPGEYVRTAWSGGALVALFELGPLVTLLLLPGTVRMWRRSRAETLRLAAMIGGSAAFAARVVSGPLIPIFLIYSLAQLALIAALGLEWAAERIVPRRARIAAFLIPALALVAIAPAHALRLHAYRHPIPPGGWTALDEDAHRPMYLLWRGRDALIYRDFGAAAMRALPESSLVVGRWREITILYYYRYALGARKDLSWQPWVYPGQLARFRDWQSRHDLRANPIVFLTLSDDMRPHLAEVESLDVSRGYRIYLARSPLRDLAAAGVQP